MSNQAEGTITSQPLIKEEMNRNPHKDPKLNKKGEWYGPWQLCESTWSCGGFEWQMIWGFCGGRSRDGEDLYGFVDCRNCCYCGPRRS